MKLFVSANDVEVGRRRTASLDDSVSAWLPRIRTSTPRLPSGSCSITPAGVSGPDLRLTLDGYGSTPTRPGVHTAGSVELAGTAGVRARRKLELFECQLHPRRHDRETASGYSIAQLIRDSSR